MKKTIKYQQGNKVIEKDVTYIPFRYILSLFTIILEFILVLAFLALFIYCIPYFYILVIITQVLVTLFIISSSDNPEYKIPWLLVVILLPVIGFMTYFMFYSRRFTPREIKLLKINESLGSINDDDVFEELKKKNLQAYGQALCLKKLSKSHMYQNTNLKYYDLGEKLYKDLLIDLNNAKKYIFMEYFIIEEGIFFNSILDVLKRKVSEGVDVKIIYDDIGCMNTLPGNYNKILKELGIDAVIFSKLKGQADNEFNNRSHRKITVIDGKYAYTGGINIADEYINAKLKFGHWKDIGLRIEGDAVNEMLKLFISDYNLNSKNIISDLGKLYSCSNISNDSFCIPFGDGPKPIYETNVFKIALINMLSQAQNYFYITTPYLIIDNEVLASIKNAAYRGVDIRIITPHIPDKKIIFKITRSFYRNLIKSGVKIYEYKPGFIHAKSYLCDDKLAIVGTMNLDYRSLVHHFENGVWLYNDPVLVDIKKDIENTINKSIQIKEDDIKDNLIRRFLRSLVRIFLPLL